MQLLIRSKKMGMQSWSIKGLFCNDNFLKFRDDISMKDLPFLTDRYKESEDKEIGNESLAKFAHRHASTIGATFCDIANKIPDPDIWVTSDGCVTIYIGYRTKMPYEFAADFPKTEEEAKDRLKKALQPYFQADSIKPEYFDENGYGWL